MHICLNVPYEEEDKAIQAGALWDPIYRRWYYPWNFKKVPSLLEWKKNFYNTYVSKYIYIVETARICWKCQKRIPIFSIGAENFASQAEGSWTFYPSFYLFNEITKYSNALNKILSIATNNRFKLPDPNTVVKSYLMTDCGYCNQTQNDHFLYDDDDAIFVPDSADKASAFVLHKFPLQYDIGLEGEVFRPVANEGTSNRLILENAKLIQYKQEKDTYTEV